MYKTRNADQWLLEHARNISSLDGEDGILEKVFETLGVTNPWCVEFGAWDGKLYSNSFHLVSSRGWSGVMIEADVNKFDELRKTYEQNSKVICLNKFVTFEGSGRLDALLATTPIPPDFELLSIDIDGNDFHVWESLQNYQPKVVAIEFNPTIPSHVDFVQPRDMKVNQGSSLLALVRLGRRKGYELICITDHNAILVKKELFQLFGIANNEIERLHPNRIAQFHIFQLYDGTFVVGGRTTMAWQNELPLRQEKFQVLPKFLRRYPLWSKNRFKNITRRLWQFLYTRGII